MRMNYTPNEPPRTLTAAEIEKTVSYTHLTLPTTSRV